MRAFVRLSEDNELSLPGYYVTRQPSLVSPTLAPLLATPTEVNIHTLSCGYIASVENA